MIKIHGMPNKLGRIAQGMEEDLKQLLVQQMTQSVEQREDEGGLNEG